MLVGCFGKLPLSPEFIKVNAGGSAVRNLDQWFQEGMQFARSRLGQTWTQDFLQADTWSFIFHPPHEEEFLVGVASPNQDRAGRTFPFFMFLRIEKAHLPCPTFLWPISMQEFLKEARTMVETGWKETDLSSFRMTVQSLQLPELPTRLSVQQQYQDYLHQNSGQWLWKECLGKHHGLPEEGLAQALRNQLVNGSKSPASPEGSGINFPIFFEGQGEGFEIPFWIDLASRVLGQDQVHSNVFWVSTPQKGKPYMLLSFRCPSSKNFLGLVRPDLLEWWWDRSVSDEPGHEISQPEPAHERGQGPNMDRPDKTLASLLEEVMSENS